MKLCRFEALASPGIVRSGFVHNAKVYETDGREAQGVYEAADVRPLAPVGTPPSIRVFRSDGPHVEALWGEKAEAPLYTFANPGAMIGPSRIVPIPEFTQELDFEAYVAAVAIEGPPNLSVQEADNHILGLTIVNMLVARDVQRMEAHLGIGPGRSHDIGIALGPVLTTPDELEDDILDDSQGRRYKLSVVGRVNGVERRRGDTEELNFSFAQLISFVSESGPIRSGDVFAIGPVMPPEEPFSGLSAGDKVDIAVEKLGILATTLSEEAL